MGVKQSSLSSDISIKRVGEDNSDPGSEVVADEDVVDTKELRRAFRALRKDKLDRKSCSIIAKSMHLLLQKEKGRKYLFNLSQESLLELVKSDDLVVRQEYDVLRLIGAWADKRVEEDEQKKSNKKRKSVSIDDSTAPNGVKTESNGIKADWKASSALYDEMSKGVAQLLNEQIKEKESKSSESGMEAEAKETDIISSADEEDSKDSESNINLRGTAGLFEAMRQGAEKLEQEKTLDIATPRLDKPSTNEVTETPKTEVGAKPAENIDNSDSGDSTPKPVAPNEKEEVPTPAPQTVTTQGSSTTTPKPVTTQPSASDDTASDSGSEDEEIVAPPDPHPGKWACPACTFLNDDSVGTCTMCSTAKPASSTGDVAIIEEEEVEIPEWKDTRRYRKQLKKHMEPFLPYIRYPMLPTEILLVLEKEDVIPQEYLLEAFRYHYLSSSDDLSKYTTDFFSSKTPRFRSRSYRVIEWDARKMAGGLKLSTDRRTVSAPNTSCSHKTVLAIHGYSSGVHQWDIKLNAQAGCYSAVGVAQSSFQLNGGLLGIAPNSWAMSMYPGSHCQTGARRKANGTGPLPSGTNIRVFLDMNRKVMAIYVNNVVKASFSQLSGIVFPALTLCHNSPPENYTLVK